MNNVNVLFIGRSFFMNTNKTVGNETVQNCYICTVYINLHEHHYIQIFKQKTIKNIYNIFWRLNIILTNRSHSCISLYVREVIK